MLFFIRVLYLLVVLLNIFPLEYVNTDTDVDTNTDPVVNEIFKDSRKRKNLPCPFRSARAAPDEYVVKIVMECAEMLTTAYRAAHGEPLLLRERRKAEEESGKSLEQLYGSEWVDNFMNYCYDRWEEMDRPELITKYDRPTRMRNENHPMSKWVRQSRSHFLWTCHYAMELAKEHLRRPLISGKKATESMYIPYFEWFMDNVSTSSIPDDGWSDMPTCMDDDCTEESGDVVLSYRNWVNRKYRTYNIKYNQKLPGTNKRKLIRIIDWKRDPSKRPSYITPGTRKDIIISY